MKKQIDKRVRKVLSDDAKTKIKTDPETWKQLSQALGIAPSAIPSALTRNSLALNQQHIVKLISEQSGIPADDILIDSIKQPKQQAAAV